MSAPRLDQLTVLRGLAAWWVVVYHARLSLTDWMPHRVIDAFAYGYLAVDIFFILSGFVMWLNYAPRLQASGLSGAPDFWWRRIARIWPLHAAIMAGLVAFAAVLTVTGRDMSDYPWRELPAHLLLVHNWGFSERLTWNDPSWSISTEMGAYLLFPFMVLWLRLERLRPVFLALGCMVLAVLLHSIFVLANSDNLGGAIPQLGLIRCVIQFAIGMLVANLWLRWRESGVGPLAGSVLVASALIIAVASGLAPQTLFLPLAFAALVLALALLPEALAARVGKPLAVWIGDISYATYLVHVPLLVLWKLLFVGEDVQIAPLSFAAYCAVLLAVSGALYHWLEKPAQRIFNARRPQRFRGLSARA